MSGKKTVFLGYFSSEVARRHVRDFGLKNCAGLMCLKSYIEADGRTRGRFDVRCEALDDRAGDEKLLSLIGRPAPALAGFSCFSINFERSVRFAKYMKEKLPDVKIVFGGPEAMDPARVLKAAPFSDAVVCGEGEEPLVRLLAGRRVPPHVSFGGEAPLIDARPAILRSLPVAPPVFSTSDSEFLSGEAYYQASRGCPGACEHCTMGLYRPVRVRSMEAVERDFEMIFSNGRVSLLTLCDAAADADPAHFNRVLAAASLHNSRETPMSGYLYLAKLEPRTLRLMRDANFRYARVCMRPREAISYRRRGRGGGLASRRFENLLRLASEPRVRVSIETAYIHPGNTYEDFREMLEILAEHGLAGSVQAVQCAALPGTRLMRRAAELRLKYSASGMHKISSCATYSAADVRRAEKLFHAMKSAARAHTEH